MILAFKKLVGHEFTQMITNYLNFARNQSLAKFEVKLPQLTCSDDCGSKIQVLQ
jgi:hypothetical protein